MKTNKKKHLFIIMAALFKLFMLHHFAFTNIYNKGKKKKDLMHL